jgi:elongation of very long chain fatty acids protein 4
VSDSSKSTNKKMDVWHFMKENYTNLYDSYLWTLTLADERVEGWFLLDSPKPTIQLTILYLLMVWLGPKFMSNRKPLKLKWTLIVYNLVMVAINAYIVLEIGLAGIRLRYNIICEPVGKSGHPDELRIATALWWFYFTKLVEFADTFFFIVRKKNNQLTFLHIYHHSTMFLLFWIAMKWVPGGSVSFGAMLNSCVHVLMYLYYGLSAIGPHVQKYLWWKRYLTVIQLGQFSTGWSLGILSFYNGCAFPQWMKLALVLYMSSYMILFGNFYRKAYGFEGTPMDYAENLVRIVLNKPKPAKGGSSISAKKEDNDKIANGFHVGNGHNKDVGSETVNNSVNLSASESTTRQRQTNSDEKISH